MYGEINKNKLNINFIKLDNKEFIEKEIDISTINFEEELIDYINNLEINENNYLKIILIGKRNFEINLNKIFKLINNKNILKIKNNTKIKYNLEEISKENNLRGIFVKNMLQRIQAENGDKESIETAIEIGLDAMQEE